ncbi:MAG: dienelactone hydrolase family protein [Hyphomonadaceae bacterium]
MSGPALMIGLMKKALIFIVIVVVLLATFIWFSLDRLALAYGASQTETRTQAELEDLLLPEMVWRLPDADVAGAGPYPLFVQMHGCGGLSMDQHGSYADIANAAGYAALIVSSNAPRGYDQQASLEQICQGKALLGQERAGDVFVALKHALQRDDIDPARIVLGGWSHGAWTVMDYLSIDGADGLPVGLDAFDGPRPEIKGAVLFYPYCGIGSRARVHGWGDQNPDVLVLMGTADTVVDHVACQVVLANLELDAGKGFEWHVYEGAEHAFDNSFLSERIAHWYHEEYSQDARAKVAGFLQAQH